jgi:hypothetical protein
VFLTERRAPMPTAGFRKMLARTAEGAEFPFPVHPHMPWRLWAGAQSRCGLYEPDALDRRMPVLSENHIRMYW